MLLYRNQNYEEALSMSKRAISIDKYDPAANYYYGIINSSLGNITDATDGFDIDGLSIEYRSAAYTELARLYFKKKLRESC